MLSPRDIARATNAGAVGPADRQLEGKAAERKCIRNAEKSIARNSETREYGVFGVAAH